jgi:hypothetical protein
MGIKTSIRPESRVLVVLAMIISLLLGVREGEGDADADGEAATDGLEAGAGGGVTATVGLGTIMGLEAGAGLETAGGFTGAGAVAAGVAVEPAHPASNTTTISRETRDRPFKDNLRVDLGLRNLAKNDMVAPSI